MRDARDSRGSCVVTRLTILCGDQHDCTHGEDFGVCCPNNCTGHQPKEAEPKEKPTLPVAWTVSVPDEVRGYIRQAVFIVAYKAAMLVSGRCTLRGCFRV